jgi:uncharacterized protein YkwD
VAITQARSLLGAGVAVAAVLVPATAAAAETNTAIVKRVNAVRASHALAPLRMSRSLDRAAAAHCAEMLSGGALSHGSLGPRLEQYTSATTFGETIAWMPSAAVGTVVRAWLQSPPHRAVLLSRRFHRIGVGARRGSLGGQSGTSFTADLAS